MEKLTTINNEIKDMATLLRQDQALRATVEALDETGYCPAESTVGFEQPYVCQDRGGCRNCRTRWALEHPDLSK